jgi:hypothetical protein
MTAPSPPIWPSLPRCVPLQSLMHHGKTKLSRRFSGFPSPVPFPLQLRRTVAINGLHLMLTGDLPRPLTSRRPRPIKGTLEHRLHTTFPFLTSARSTGARIALPLSSVITHLFPTVADSPPAVHHPAPPLVRTTLLPSPFALRRSELPSTRAAKWPMFDEPCHPPCHESMVDSWTGIVAVVHGTVDSAHAVFI